MSSITTATTALDRADSDQGDRFFRAGESAELVWQVPDLEGYPIAKVGVQISGGRRRQRPRIYLDWLTWDGAPNVRLKRPHPRGISPAGTASWAA